MAVATAEGATVTRADKLRDNIGFFGLLGAFIAYTLATLDGGDIAPWVISAFVLFVSALYLGFPIQQRLTINVPIVCLVLMAAYGAAQTIWSQHKILYNGWTGVLFWFTAAAICLVSAPLFRNQGIAAQFRLSFVLFGSAVCLLDLLEQASHTNRYFWIIQSRYATVSGPFAYWNNFAQFVELLLPITLWLGFSGPKRDVRFLLLSGLQIGAVIASGSRAGSALVIAELLAVAMVGYFRNRNSRWLYAPATVSLVMILFAFTAGFEPLSNKLQQHDQLSVRRDINASSGAMIRERPLTGWGLGTYVPVYRAFARHDDGSYVNRAHNDWLEWAAEGGILFSALMAAIFVWSIKPAIRSVWGIGLIAVCLHAVVDYPFARFGVCAWYFGLLGMLAAGTESERARGGPKIGTSLGEIGLERSAVSGV